MEAARYFAIVQRWWWLLLVGTLITVAAFGVASRVRGRDGVPEYSASATLFVSDPNATAAGDTASAVTSDRLLRSYATIVGGPGVALRVIDNLGLRASIASVEAHIVVAVPPGTQLIEVTTMGASALEAEQLSTAVIQAFITIHDEGQLPGAATVSAATSARETIVTPRPDWQVALIVAVFGLLSAASIVVIFEYLTDTVRDAVDAEAAAGLPVLASVPLWAAGRSARFATAIGGRSAEQAAERFRMLRTAIRLDAADHPAQVLLFTAANRSAGATTAAANYAFTLAQSGRTVAIVDANLREPAQHRMFGVTSTPGLSDVLAEPTTALDSVIQPTSIDSVSLVPAGLCPPNPSELLDGPRFDAVIAELRGRFDCVVIDSPPALSTTDATLLATRSDGVVVVVRADQTSRANCAAAVAMLATTSSRMLGIVVNGATQASGLRPMRAAESKQHSGAGAR
jgi:capsular exopolysaccharide synthesis family protein